MQDHSILTPKTLPKPGTPDILCSTSLNHNVAEIRSTEILELFQPCLSRDADLTAWVLPEV